MSTYGLAKTHFDAAMQDARDNGFDPDAVARYMLDLVVAQYLTTRPLADVRAELRFVADNCNLTADFTFIRP